jgi:hypothetical protein
MSQYGYNQQQPNLQFYSSNYSNQPIGGQVSGHSTPFQAYSAGGASASNNAYPSTGFSSGFGTQGVSGQMGTQGGLRTGWLAAFGTEGYDGVWSMAATIHVY